MDTGAASPRLEGGGDADVNGIVLPLRWASVGETGQTAETTASGQSTR